jgi:PilZ domain
MKTSERKERRSGRKGVLANFEFYVDGDSKEICEGITLNISDGGFGFLTEVEIREGQTITVTKHALSGLSCPKARVTWVKKGRRCIEAGAEFQPGK